MANIRLDLTIPVYDGQEVTFKAPCNSTDITGLIVYYPDGDSTVSKVFTLKDAHGNNLDTVDLFAEGVYLTAVLDTVNAFAYFKNADTNAYLEGRFNEYLPLTGGTVTKAGIDALKIQRTVSGVVHEAGFGVNGVSFNGSETYPALITLYRDGSQIALLQFNETGIRLRDSKNSKNYNVFGEHNITAGTTNLTSGTSSLTTGCIYQQYV